MNDPSKLPRPPAPWRSCLRKRRFATEAKAEGAAKTARLRYYECGLCGGYHLTKKRHPSERGAP